MSDGIKTALKKSNFVFLFAFWQAPCRFRRLLWYFSLWALWDASRRYGLL